MHILPYHTLPYPTIPTPYPTLSNPPSRLRRITPAVHRAYNLVKGWSTGESCKVHTPSRSYTTTDTPSQS